MLNQKRRRDAPVDLSGEEFRKLGHALVDSIAEFIDNIEDKPVTSAEDEVSIRKHLNADKPLPEDGRNPGELLSKATDLLMNHSLFNGHPRFWGYVTSSPAPLGILGDLLASAVNSNVGAWALSPMASEIESQTVKWIGSLIGYPSNGGLIVSGGAVANYIGFIAALRSKAGLGIRNNGINAADKSLIIYCSQETHTWIQKASDLFGLGTDNIRWVRTDHHQRMDVTVLKDNIEEDINSGNKPVLVVGTAGTVSTGAIDPLNDIADICKQYGLWFHIDGAYGGFAAAVPELAGDFAGLDKADSIAVDPHKWLYAPLEAGCTLVKNPVLLTDAFSYHPPYYNFEQTVVNYVDYGIQNSRGFKALKVWLLLQQMGAKGYQKLIWEDILLAQYAFSLFSGSENIETYTCNLSITTFRYIPADLRGEVNSEAVGDYLNDLNRKILEKIEKSGKFFVSNAFIENRFLLRMCIVNFRTGKHDIEAFLSFLTETGKVVDQELRPVPSN